MRCINGVLESQKAIMRCPKCGAEYHYLEKVRVPYDGLYYFCECKLCGLEWVEKVE